MPADKREQPTRTTRYVHQLSVMICTQLNQRCELKMSLKEGQWETDYALFESWTRAGDGTLRFLAAPAQKTSGDRLCSCAYVPIVGQGCFPELQVEIAAVPDRSYSWWRRWVTAKWLFYRETGNRTQNYARSGNVTFGGGRSEPGVFLGSFGMRDEDR